MAPTSRIQSPGGFHPWYRFICEGDWDMLGHALTLTSIPFFLIVSPQELADWMVCDDGPREAVCHFPLACPSFWLRFPEACVCSYLLPPNTYPFATSLPLPKSMYASVSKPPFLVGYLVLHGRLGWEGDPPNSWLLMTHPLVPSPSPDLPSPTLPPNPLFREASIWGK